MGGTRGSPIMPRDAVSRTAHVGTVGKNGLKESMIHTTVCVMYMQAVDTYLNVLVDLSIARAVFLEFGAFQTGKFHNRFS